VDPYAATSREPGVEGGSGRRDWGDVEPRLGVTLRRATARLLQRSRASWPIWTLLVGLMCAGIWAWRVRHPPPFTTTLAFRITEGAVPVAPESLSSRALRAYIYDLALSRHNLAALAEQDAATSAKGRKTDIGDAVTDILEATSLTIGESDFIEDRTPGDPPRSVRIELTFKAASPDRSWAMAHALADLMVTSERNRRVRIVDRQTAESEAATQRTGPSVRGDGPAGGDSAAARAGHETDLRDSAQAWLARRSLQGDQGLRFELADPGRPPADPSPGPWSSVISLVLALPLLLLAAALLAGAADPRVLDSADLTAMGIVVLGRVHPTARV
jgi:hypothetical protein